MCTNIKIKQSAWKQVFYVQKHTFSRTQPKKHDFHTELNLYLLSCHSEMLFAFEFITFFTYICIVSCCKIFRFIHVFIREKNDFFYFHYFRFCPIMDFYIATFFQKNVVFSPVDDFCVYLNTWKHATNLSG